MAKCGLCGHNMTLETCGAASVYEGDTKIDLCHGDCTGPGPMTCYHRWTAYGQRPLPGPVGGFDDDPLTDGEAKAFAQFLDKES